MEKNVQKILVLRLKWKNEKMMDSGSDDTDKIDDVPPESKKQDTLLMLLQNDHYISHHTLKTLLHHP